MARDWLTETNESSFARQKYFFWMLTTSQTVFQELGVHWAKIPALQERTFYGGHDGTDSKSMHMKDEQIIWHIGRW